MSRVRNREIGQEHVADQSLADQSWRSFLSQGNAIADAAKATVELLLTSCTVSEELRASVQAGHGLASSQHAVCQKRRQPLSQEQQDGRTRWSLPRCGPLTDQEKSKSADIEADSALRTWVLLPIVLVMVLVGLLRHYVTQLIDTPPKPQPLKAVREQCVGFLLSCRISTQASSCVQASTDKRCYTAYKWPSST